MGNIPFRAALFDLDGTLLKSMDVWKRVDEAFFARRGMDVPVGYGDRLAGLSFDESAAYTVKHYLPNEDRQVVLDEWTALTQREYAEHVALKPGARAYLRMLRREGVKLAVATALPPKLYAPCLKRLGLLEMFDALCSTEDVGGRGKESGEVYLLAARQLGVKPEECAVFEDVSTGIAGARRAGMRAYGVRDEHGSAENHAAMAALADGMVDTLDQMCAYHDFPPARCVIFTARCEGDVASVYAPQYGDYVLCADGGWQLAQRLGVRPDLVIGDFDSSPEPEGVPVERLPTIKDDTDTMQCVKRGLEMGYDDFLIVGGFGGRFDHTLANIQTLHYAAARGARVRMEDGLCAATALCGGSVKLARRRGKLSLFALTDVCRGVSALGVFYPLHGAELINGFPLGVSNEYVGDFAEISVEEGVLLIVQTDEE